MRHAGQHPRFSGFSPTPTYTGLLISTSMAIDGGGGGNSLPALPCRSAAPPPAAAPPWSARAALAGWRLAAALRGGSALLQGDSVRGAFLEGQYLIAVCRRVSETESRHVGAARRRACPALCRGWLTKDEAIKGGQRSGGDDGARVGPLRHWLDLWAAAQQGRGVQVGGRRLQGNEGAGEQARAREAGRGTELAPVPPAPPHLLQHLGRQRLGHLRWARGCG